MPCIFGFGFCLCTPSLFPFTSSLSLSFSLFAFLSLKSHSSVFSPLPFDSRSRLFFVRCEILVLCLRLFASSSWVLQSGVEEC
ncbi:hypothetical protein RIF29_37829 [Crotalaria pallida]|uniref:Uncharacterized protein n=1 Tax=Crotalaria pallida TaxID=3830 RepID=A0AAN9HKZ4_CROPI